MKGENLQLHYGTNKANAVLTNCSKNRAKTSARSVNQPILFRDSTEEQ